MLLYTLLAPQHEAIITTGGLIIAALVTALGGIQVALIQSGRKAAKLAAARSAPTGNGFAGRTETALADVLAAVDSLRSDVADVRATTRRVEDRLDAHIDRRPT